MRATYADTSWITYRLKSASALLGVTPLTLRQYVDKSGIQIPRASDFSPGALPIRIFSIESMFKLAQYRREHGYVRKPRKSPRVITVDVIKGGTGKTTTAVELAMHLQLSGLRVLLIDLDVQANATQMMGYEPDLTLDEAPSYGLDKTAIVTKTFAHVLIPFISNLMRGSVMQSINASDLLKKPFGDAGPHLVPADTFLGDIEQAIANAKGQRELLIRRFLEAARRGEILGLDATHYDVIIFDCPPSISFTSTAAIAAADFVVAPVRLDVFSVKGLTKLMRELEMLAEAYDVRPTLIILPTHFSPQLARIGRMQLQLQTHYRDLLAPCSIHASEEFPKAIEHYLPLSLLKPLSQAFNDYRTFAEYMHERIVK